MRENLSDKLLSSESIQCKWIKGPRPTDRDYLNYYNCENMIGWPPNLPPISFANCQIQGFNWCKGPASVVSFK